MSDRYSTLIRTPVGRLLGQEPRAGQMLLGA